MLRDSKAETTEDRLENLQELIGVAGGFHTARELLDHATLATSRPGEDETARVRLMTLHKAKGLEFPHVFLPAWEAGVLPSDYGDRDEERRLAYVALTRGMRRVTISIAGFAAARPSRRLLSTTFPTTIGFTAGSAITFPSGAPPPARRSRAAISRIDSGAFRPARPASDREKSRQIHSQSEERP